MKFRTLLIIFLIAAAATSCNYVFAQANVSENESVTLYVNAQSGSDSDPGTYSRPLKTIQAAVAKALINNSHGAGTRIQVAPGVYHELVNIGYSYGMTGAPITIEASTTGTAIIDAADVLTGIRSDGNGLYTARWKDDVYPCALPPGWPTDLPPITERREMLFVNGVPLTQVLSPEQGRAGTFWINQQYGTVDIWAPTGIDLNTAQVEIANRANTLTVQGRSNMVFRGLVFQHAASCMNQSGVEVFSSRNILFDHVQATWNNWSGLDISGSSYITVQYSIGSYNGGAGLSGFHDLYSLFQSNETDYNNWRGGMGGLYDFSQSGTKLMGMHSAQVLGQLAYNNLAQGLWFDTDNEDVTINDAILSGSLLSNLQLEASQGPITLENSSLCSAGEDGVVATDAENVTMTGNHFYNNGGTVPFLNGQLYLAGAPDGRYFTDWQTGQTLHTTNSNMKLEGNTLTSVGPQQFVFNTYLSGTQWDEFANSLQSGNNHWSNSSQPTDFIVQYGRHENLSGWQNVTGQDLSSYWVSYIAAPWNCAPPRPAYPDFNVYAHNSAAFLPAYYMGGGHVAINIGVNSFDFGLVQLSVKGLPAGVSAYFSRSSLYSGISVLTLKATTWAKWETVPVTVFAVSGSRVHTVTFSVAVRPS